MYCLLSSSRKIKLSKNIPFINYLATSTHSTSNSILQQSKNYLGLATGGAILFAGIGTAYQIKNDEGFARSVYFWRKAFPIYLRYRLMQHRVANLPDHEQDIHYNVLHEKYAAKVFDIVLHLQGFYIKLAQIGSTRSDFLPPQYLERAEELQDNAPCKKPDEIRKIIEDSLQCNLDEVFIDFDAKPLGAASIGQAHLAKLKDGRQVVIKVQYPQAESHFRADIATIKAFCKLAQPVHVPFLDEVEKQFMTEFDYRAEAKNLMEVGSNLKKSRWNNYVVVPQPIEELCTKDVLVMEYIPGKKLVKALREHFDTLASQKGVTVEELKEEQRKKDEEREAKGLSREEGLSSRALGVYNLMFEADRLAKNTCIYLYNHTLGLAYGYQDYVTKKRLINLPNILGLLIQIHGHEIFVDGCFNGDPHPGNILLLPDGRLGLIDYGQVKHINKEQRLNLAKLVVALSSRKTEKILQVLQNDLGVQTKESNPYVLEKLGTMFMDRDDKSVTEGMNPQLFMEKLEKIDPITHMPDDYIMAFRVSLLLRGLSYALRYDISHAKEWYPLAKQVLEEEGYDIQQLES